MKDKNRIGTVGLNLLVLLLAVLLVAGSFGFRYNGPAAGNVRHIDHMSVSMEDGASEEIKLPYTFHAPHERTKVIFETEILPKAGDVLYIKSVYAPAKIFLDGQLVHEFGKKENYPGFMLDPATEIQMIDIGKDGERTQLRMEFLSPFSRKNMVVQPPIMGSVQDIILERFGHVGMSFILSICQILFGISIIFISMCLEYSDRNMNIFLWLGFFSLTTGMWAFGENNMTGIFVKNSTFLYLISFIGLFIFIVPLLRFTRAIIHFEHERLIIWMENIVLVNASVAFLLQFTRRIALSKSMFVMHFLLPCILVVMTVLIIRESVNYNNIYARRFILPTGILAVSAILELINYKIPFTYVFSSLFQMGIMVFMLFMGFVAGLYLKDNRNLRNRERELAFENRLMEIQISEQKNRSDMLAKNEQLLSEQRHDLRHHLMAIRELVKDENIELQEYLNQMMADIPKASRKFCQNQAVNAVVSYYYVMCEKQQIDPEFNLDIPENNPQISDGDLCAIFGNLLENAVEACGRMKDGPRFIRLNTSVQYDTLVITMDNSFNGKIEIDGEHFYSAKRDGFGIGTSSIRTLARKAGGDAIFKINGKIFLSSVYVIL